MTGRYSALSSSCTARGKSLQAALQSLNAFDKELAEFLVWMGEAEGSLEQMDSRELAARVEEVTAEMRERDERFRGLVVRGQEQLAHSGQSDIVLRSKVDELKRRWTGLQNCVLNLSSRASKDDAKENGGVDQAKAWLSAKIEEVEALEMGKNLAEIRRQLEENTSFRLAVISTYVNR